MAASTPPRVPELFFKALAHRVANRHPDESISVVIEGQSYGLTSSSTYIR